MRRKLFVVVAIVALLFPVSVFSSGTQETAETTPITVYLTEHQDIVDPIRDKLAEFEEASNIKVNLETVPEGDSTTKLSLILSSGAEGYDVFYIASVNSVAGMVNHQFAPIKNHLSANGNDLSDFPQPLLDLLSRDGILYGLPIRAETNILMYRKDKLEANGIKVPTTLDEYAAAAEKLTRGNFYGNAQRGLYGHNAYTFTYYFRALGGKFFDNDMNPTLYSPEGIAALNMYRELASTYAPPGGSVYGWQDVFAALQTGLAAMTVESSIQAGLLEDPAKSLNVGKFGYAVPPAGPNGSTPDLKCYGYFINEKSAHKEAAAKFIEWATGAELQKYAFDKYGFAAITRNSVLEASQDKAPYFGAIKDAMATGDIYFLPPISEQGAVYMATCQAITDALAGTKTVEQALRDANEVIRKIIQDGGYYDGKTEIPQFIRDGRG